MHLEITHEDMMTGLVTLPELWKRRNERSASVWIMSYARDVAFDF